LAAFVEVGNALATVRDDKLYRASYDTFEAYCKERWGLARNSAYRYIDAAEVAEVLSPIGDTVPLPTTESQARELVPLLDKPGKLRKAYKTAAKRKGGTPTARAIGEAVAEQLPAKSAPSESAPVQQGLMLVMPIHQPEADYMLRAARKSEASLETWAYGVLLAAVSTAEPRGTSVPSVTAKRPRTIPAPILNGCVHRAGPMLSGGIHLCVEKGCQARKVGGRWIEVT
jgi:hypothetical protein